MKKIFSSDNWLDGHELTDEMKERIIVLLARHGDTVQDPSDPRGIIPEGSLAAFYLMEYWHITKTLSELLKEHGVDDDRLMQTYGLEAGP